MKALELSRVCEFGAGLGLSFAVGFKKIWGSSRLITLGGGSFLKQGSPLGDISGLESDPSFGNLPLASASIARANRRRRFGQEAASCQEQRSFRV